MFDSFFLLVMGIGAGAIVMTEQTQAVQLGVIGLYGLLVGLYFMVALPYHRDGVVTIEIEF